MGFVSSQRFSPKCPWRLVTRCFTDEIAIDGNVIPTYYHLCLLYFSLLFFTLINLFCHRRRVDTIGCMSFTQLLTSVIGVPISLYHSGISSSQRFRGLPIGRWITRALLWGAVGAILLTCDHHHLILLAVCSAGCMFTRRLTVVLISEILVCSLLNYLD